MEKTHDIEGYILGQTDESIQLEDRNDNILISQNMIKQCRKSLYIISRKLDPLIFSTAEFVDACKNLALHDYRSHIKVVVLEPEIVVKHDHRLLTLSHKIGSAIEFRKAHHSFANYNQCLVLADTIGYIHRGNGERYEGKANFKDQRLCKNLLKQFTDMWELATSDLNLRNLVV